MTPEELRLRVLELAVEWSKTSSMDPVESAKRFLSFIGAEEAGNE